MMDARNPDLEAAIAANPLDRDPYLVFADWLLQQGDPRGELMSLQLAGKEEEAEAFLAKHEDYFLGPLAEHKLVYDEGGNNGVSSLRTSEQEDAWQQIHTQAFRWRNGFIHYLRLSHDEDQLPKELDGTLTDVLDQVLDHPSGRYIVEVAFHGNGNLSDDNLQSLVDKLAEKAPASLRKLTLGDNIDQISWHHVGSIAALWPSVAQLKTLEIETGELEVGEPGQMNAPALERAVFVTGGMSPSCARGIATAQMPNIQHLEIYYGDPNYGGISTIDDVMPLLERADLTKLRYLGLKNSMFANDIARLVANAKVIKNLETLDLSLGAMTDEGAKHLAENAQGLAHLKTLDLKRNFLTPAGIELVKNLCPSVLTDGQEKPYERSNGELRYFVSVAE
jgi:uncharacterized protein (TIGR02996 family)